MSGRRGGPPAPRHAVVIGEALGRDHYASSSCWCHPAASWRDLATAAPIYLHANPPAAAMAAPAPGIRPVAPSSAATGTTTPPAAREAPAGARFSTTSGGTNRAT